MPTPHNPAVMPNKALSTGPPFRKTGNSLTAYKS